jgi:hypothetical protein
MSRGDYGVLVTRHDYNRYTAEMASEVPSGLTREHDFAA